MAAIELAGTGHRYAGADEDALHPIELVLADGETYALLGPSGCGKTTLLNVVSGLLRPSTGRVLFDGENVTERATSERNVAQVFQFPVVYDTMSVRDNLAFPLRNRGIAEVEVLRRVDEIAEVLELSADLDCRARGLGADAKQRIALGRGLVRDDVAAILLDEPLTLIDPGARWALRRKLREVHLGLRRTLVHVTHDQGEALTIADRVVVMNAGRVVQVGTPQELVETPAHTFVASFLGNPGMNLIPCQVSGGVAMIGDATLTLPVALADRSARAQGPLELGIRPEHIVISADGIDARIERVHDLGRHWIADLRLGHHGLKLKGEGSARPTPGEATRVRFAPDRLHLFADGRIVR